MIRKVRTTLSVYCFRDLNGFSRVSVKNFFIKLCVLLNYFQTQKKTISDINILLCFTFSLNARYYSHITTAICLVLYCVCYVMLCCEIRTQYISSLSLSLPLSLSYFDIAILEYHVISHDTT